MSNEIKGYLILVIGICCLIHLLYKFFKKTWYNDVYIKCLQKAILQSNFAYDINDKISMY